MSKARTLANLISDNAELADGQISVAEVVGAAPTASPTFTGNIDAGDNVKIRLGDSDDLQIYHDGSNSYINETGTGDLYIKCNDEIRIQGQDDANLIYAQQDGSVGLYYNGSNKFSTTNTGINVTGTAVTDGLTVAGNVSVDGGTIKLDGNYPNGVNNVALGNTALDTASGSNGYSVAIGTNALTAMTSGGSNVGVGYASGAAITTGGNNVAVGTEALDATTTGGSNVAVGSAALGSNTTASDNTAVGHQAMTANTTGTSNTVSGTFAAYSNTTGGNNTASGFRAFQDNTTGSSNVAIGAYALDDNTTASENTAIGYSALGANTTGLVNVAVGSNALADNTTGGSLVAIGREALANNTTASNNTAVGKHALRANTTGDTNVAIGKDSMLVNTTGTNNTAVGPRSLQANTSSANNVAVGDLALGNNTTGSSNVSVGTDALRSNTTAINNTAVGYQAGYSHVNSGGKNVFIGNAAGYSTTTQRNTFVGEQAGFYMSSGSGKNTILGRFNGNQDSIDIRTAANRIVIADGDGNVGLYMDNNSQAFFGDMARQTDGANLNVNVVGSQMGLNVYQDSSGDTILCKMRHARANTGNYANATMIQFCRDNGTEIGSIKGVQSNVTYNTSSDHRLKENVVYDWDATTRLKQLKPARFNFIADETNTTVDGFLAHEAQAVVPQSVHGTHNEVKVWQSGEDLPDGVSVGDNKLDDDGNTIPVMQGIDHSTLVPLLVKTIQELEARITALEGA